MSAIFLRPTHMHDLPAIEDVIARARQALKNSGNPQWQDGQPTTATIINDITHHLSWALIVDGQLAGVASLQPSPEESFENISQGEWANSTDPYLVIHRLAIGDQYRGHQLSSFLLSNLVTVGQIKGVSNFRLGTHQKNAAMQAAAKKFGFKYRGRVKVHDGCDPNRYAFELNLDPHKFPMKTGVKNNFMGPLVK